MLGYPHRVIIRLVAFVSSINGFSRFSIDRHFSEIPLYIFLSFLEKIHVNLCRQLVL